MKIYLAGRCNSPKRKLIPVAAKSEYVASDIWDYDDIDPLLNDYSLHGTEQHDWPMTYDHCRVEVNKTILVREYAEPLVYGSDLMIAYVDDPKAFGTLAEIGMANARDIPVIMFILGPILPETEAERVTMLAIDDAYWFASYLSNVRAVRSDKFDHFQHIVKQLDQIESPIELSLYLRIFTFGVHTQYRVGKYRLDFAFPDKKLAVECDGHAYHSTRDQRGRDADRDRDLIAQGWTVIRFTGSQIHENPERCADEVRRILYTRAAVA